MDRKTQEQSHGRLRNRMDLLEEAFDAGLSDNHGSQSLLRGRVTRLEQAVGAIYEAQATMDGSLRELSAARLKIKQALCEVVSDIADLSRLLEPEPDDR